MICRSGCFGIQTVWEKHNFWCISCQITEVGQGQEKNLNAGWYYGTDTSWRIAWLCKEGPIFLVQQKLVARCTFMGFLRIQVKSLMVQVVVEGFHHKLMSLVEMIVEKIVSFEIKEDRFDFVKVRLQHSCQRMTMFLQFSAQHNVAPCFYLELKLALSPIDLIFFLWSTQELVVRNYVNMRFMQPQAQANYNINHLLQHTSWHLTECLDVLPSLDARALTVFFPRLLSRVFIEAFIGGSSLLLRYQYEILDWYWKDCSD